MIKRKRIREKGKLPLSKVFKKFDSGESVAVVRELNQDANFPMRIHGRTGKVVGKRGRSYVVEVNDFSMKKKHIIMPIHLKKIEDKK